MRFHPHSSAAIVGVMHRLAENAPETVPGDCDAVCNGWKQEHACRELLQLALSKVSGVAGGAQSRGLFLAGNAAASNVDLAGLQGAVLHGIYGAGRIAALEAVVNAAAAVVKKACDVAIVVALDNTAHGMDAAAIILTHTPGPSQSVYAWLRAGVVDLSDATEIRVSRILMETCERTQINPSSLTLIDLLVEDGEGALDDALNVLRPHLSRGPRALPHCNLGSATPSLSALDALRRVCVLTTALQERVLPAYAGLGAEVKSPFCANCECRPWIVDSPRRAAMIGFTAKEAAAIVLEECPSSALPIRADKAWPWELVLAGARTREDLIVRLQSIAREAGLHQLSKLAAAVQNSDTQHRAAIVANDTEDLRDKIRRIIERLAYSDSGRFQTTDGIYYSNTQIQPAGTAVLFPGQGSHYLGMFGDLCLYLPQLQAWFEALHHALGDGDRCPSSLLISGPQMGLNPQEQRTRRKRLWTLHGGGFASIVGSLGLYDIVTSAGVRPDVIAGYSNGENAALIASGAWHFSNLGEMFEAFIKIRRRGVFESPLMDIHRGHSVTVNNVPRALLEDLLRACGDRVFIALDNCPSQVMIFGSDPELREIVETLKQAGAVCLAMPFDRGHHTPAFADELEQLKPLYREFRYGRSQIPLYSCCSADVFPGDEEQVRELAQKQWIEPIRFRDTIERLYSDGIRCFVEMGPDANLTSFVRNTLQGRDHIAVASNIKSKAGLQQLLRMLGQLFVLGHNIRVDALKASGSELKLPAGRDFEHEAENRNRQPIISDEISGDAGSLLEQDRIVSELVQ